MRMNTTHCVNIKSISNGFIKDASGTYCELRVQLQCRGLPMKATSLHVVARSIDSFSTVSHFLPRCPNDTSNRELPNADLERGDSGFFALRYNCDGSLNTELIDELWPGLNTQRGRKIRLVVRCGDVTVATIWPSRFEWTQSIWNKFAFWIARLTQYHFPHPLTSERCSSSRIKLPTFNAMIRNNIQMFASNVTTLLAKKQASE